MQKKTYRGLIILILFFFSIDYCRSQDTLVKQLNEITISATRVEKKVYDTGRSVTVITDEDISCGDYSTLAEILSQQEGIYVTGTGQTPGSNQSIFLRGANSNQTAIYIDGLRITDASTVNNTIDLSELPLHDIERIEILRGSHSTLYGSAAIGGVINITTRQAKKEGWQMSSGLSTGTFGTGTSLLNPFAEAGYTFSNGFYLRGIFDYSKCLGLDATLDTVTDPTIYKTSDNDNWKKMNTGVSLGYKRKNTELGLNYRYTKMETDIDKSAYVDDDNYVLNFKRSTLSGLFNQQLLSDLNVTFTGGLSWNQRHAINDSSLISWNQLYDHQYTEDLYHGRTANMDMVLHRKSSHMDLILGFAVAGEEMTSDNYLYAAFYSDPFPPFIYEKTSNLGQPNPSTLTTSLYTQADVRGEILSVRLKNFNLVAGCRYDLNDIISQQFSYEINPSWKIGSKSLLYFSYSTGYNAPSLYQLYSPTYYTPWDGSDGSGITLGNNLLHSEKSISTEIGFKKKIQDSGLFNISLYKRTNKNQIEYAYLWNGAVPIESLGADLSRDDYRGDTYLNVGSGTTYGLEISLLFQLIKNLNIGSGLSLLNGEMTYKNTAELQSRYAGTHVQLYNNGQFLDASTTKQSGLIRRPNSAKIEVIYTGIRKLQAHFVTKFIDDRQDVYYDTQIKPQGALNTISVQDYTLFDFSISYNFGTHLLISSRIENILDKEYAEIRGFTTRGRSLYFKIVFKL